MDLDIIVPVVEKIVKDELRRRQYPFGMPEPKGLSNKNATGTLINSIKAQVYMDGTAETIQINAAGYGGYVNNVRLANTAKDVPIMAIMEWIGEKGIGVRDERGRFIKGHREFRKVYQTSKEKGKILPIAFAIQKSIQKFGIRAANFESKAFQKIAENKFLLDLLGEVEIKKLQDIIKFNYQTNE